MLVLIYTHTLPVPPLPSLPHLPPTGRVEDMMKRSYAEDETTRHEVDRKQALKQLEEDFKSLQRLECPVCDQDLDHYYTACSHIQRLRAQMQVV